MDHVRNIAPIQKQPAAATPPRPVAAAPVRANQAIWAQLAPFRPNWRLLRKQRIVAGSPSDPANVAFDVLRTKVLRLLRENNWKSVAVTSPTEGCGKSVVALNLAFSLAKVADSRTAIFDLDLRRPSMRHLLGIEAPLSMEKFLRGSAAVGETFLRWEDSLAIGACAAGVPDSTELLQNPSSQAAVARVQELLQPDVMVFDMPPVFDNGDVLTFASRADCVLLVAAAGSTTLAEIEACERELARETRILGIVLNKCRYMPRKGGY